MKEIEFTCPACGSHRLEEVMSDVVVSSVVKDISVDGGVADIVYGEQTNEDGVVECFQCIDCGTQLRLDNDMLVTTAEELAQWFAEHPAVGYTGAEAAVAKASADSQTTKRDKSADLPVYRVVETVTYEVPAGSRAEAVDLLINGGDPNRFFVGVSDRCAERIDPDGDYDADNDPPYDGDED